MGGVSESWVFDSLKAEKHSIHEARQTGEARRTSSIRPHRSSEEVSPAWLRFVPMDDAGVEAEKLV